ncbi:winged helix-turn-helix transcriptional regulator [Sphingobacterium olei]|uniref:Winged helix-turn-helix transcriptional regulator n=1 Tax=Sphingobacterium olei TaxID=2571155 RepID=A0A4U0PHJ8_9SPHI|nr:winged helix-turn-helix transcriptional regulator [Sphingobacterium olei]
MFPSLISSARNTTYCTIRAIRERNHKITIPELSEIVGINATNIQDNVKKLHDMGKINCIDPAKGGHWKIIDGYYDTPDLFRGNCYRRMTKTR